jgi:RecQ-mediated genome instability protein 1
MLLKDVFFRRGIGFLEPKTIVLKGFENEDLQANQETDFLNALNGRMGCVFVHTSQQDT